MLSTSLSLGEYFTPGPYAVGPKEPLSNARRLMGKYGLGHLPVRAEGKIVGLLSGRVLGALAPLLDERREDVAVEAAMSTDPLEVDVETPLGEVVRAMAGQTRDAAVVLRHGSVVGVFAGLFLASGRRGGGRDENSRDPLGPCERPPSISAGPG